MPEIKISAKRLHVVYTAPLSLGLVSFFLIWIPLFSLVPWRQTAGTVLKIEHVQLGNSSSSADEIAPSVYFGLLGSCYQEFSGAPLECTDLAFPAHYNTTIRRAGPILNADHLGISMPDLPPVFAVWALVSLVSLLCHFVGTLPLYVGPRFYHFRFHCKPLFQASLWILGIAWAFGFSAVLSLACFIQGFGAEYNEFSLFHYLNHARSGPIFYFFVPAMCSQILIILSLLVAIENATTKEREAFSDSWTTHVNMRGT